MRNHGGGVGPRGTGVGRGLGVGVALGVFKRNVQVKSGNGPQPNAPAGI